MNIPQQLKEIIDLLRSRLPAAPALQEDVEMLNASLFAAQKRNRHLEEQLKEAKALASDREMQILHMLRSRREEILSGAAKCAFCGHTTELRKVNELACYYNRCLEFVAKHALLSDKIAKKYIGDVAEWLAEPGPDIDDMREWFRSRMIDPCAEDLSSGEVALIDLEGFIAEWTIYNEKGKE